MSIERGSNTEKGSRDEQEGVETPKKISEINPVQESTSVLVRNEEDLKELIEAPLLSACEELYEKNIRTLSTSANQKDIEFQTGHIIIDFDSLSDENKEVGKQLGETISAGNASQLSIKIPITENSTFDEIKEYAESIARQFKKQPMTWAQTYTLKEVRKIYGIDPDDASYGADMFADYLYYDPEQQLFYESEEHAQKVKEQNDVN